MVAPPPKFVFHFCRLYLGQSVSDESRDVSLEEEQGARGGDDVCCDIPAVAGDAAALATAGQ